MCKKKHSWKKSKVEEKEEKEKINELLLSSFEGKQGKDVESENAVSWYYKKKKLGERYDESAAYRIVKGPSIVLWGESGFDESLFGLQIDLDFGVFGSLRGIVQKQHDPFKISWRCGPDFDKRSGETFISTTAMKASEIVAWYYLQKDDDDRPSWVNTDNEHVGEEALNFVHSLKSAVEGTKLVNWQPLPNEAHGFFQHSQKYDSEERMYVTLSKLNDPEGAMFYGSGKIYPVPFLLAMYAYSINIDPSTALPILTNEENKELFTYVDRFAHFLVKRDDDNDGRPGFKQLGGLEAIVEEYSNEKINSEKAWKKAYLFAQALMLLLSDKYEEPIRSYHMVDDLDRLHKLCTGILNVFNSAMSPSRAPNDATLAQLKKDLQFNSHHLNHGSFITIVTDETFQKDKKNEDRYITFQECLYQNSNLHTTQTCEIQT